MIELLHGDCLEQMKSLPDNSVDSIVTDPPAGIAFMGKEWDKDKGGRKQWIAWMESVAKECIRVIKPGGHALVWAIPRTSHWTGMAWEDAGWTPREKIYHCFGSGFPKSANISKHIDRMAGAEREVIGIKNNKGRVKSEGWGMSDSNGDDITAPATEAAKQWSGWGTSMKPAIEEWWMFRKPFKSTVAENVLKWGTGGLNIDGCRVGMSNSDTAMLNGKSSKNPTGVKSGFGGGIASKPHQQGRFPANLILSYPEDEYKDGRLQPNPGKDEVMGLFPQTKSGGGVKVTGNGETPGSTYCLNRKERGRDWSVDSGSAARFFYVAKSSKSDRNSGMEGLYKCEDCNIIKHISELTSGCPTCGETMTPFTNIHATVKPTKLMCYLVRLVTPPGGTVLDPFMGSGSTGKACKLEGFGFIGIEMETEYINIARARIEAAQPETCNQLAMFETAQ